jgi:hypothetical protein
MRISEYNGVISKKYSFSKFFGVAHSKYSVNSKHFEIA